MALICAGCKQNVPNTDYLTCSLCNSVYDLECANINNERFKIMIETESIETWKCLDCYCKIPKRGNINTPIRPQEHDSRPITSPPEINNVTIRRTIKPMNDTTSSLDLSLLGDTIYAQDEGKTPQSITQTELTLQNIGEMIMLRLKENNRSIITELQNTIQLELNKAILKLREDFERETNCLLRQNEERKMDIQHVNTEIENLKIENEKLKTEIESLKTRSNTSQTNCTESYSKKIVLYGFDEYYKEPVNNLHIRLINLFREFMNVDLMGYIEETYRIGKRSSKNRPLVIEILSKRMVSYLKENSNVFRGTRLFLSEFLDDEARRERKLLREEMLKARRKGLYAVIRDNQLFIDGKIINKIDNTPANQMNTNKWNTHHADLSSSQNNDNFFRRYTDTGDRNRTPRKQRPTI